MAENVSVSRPTTIIQLVTASGEQLKIVGYVTAPIQVGDMQNNRTQLYCGG